SYTFGLSANAVLQRETEGLLAEAVAAYERERQAARQQDPPRPAVPSRLFTGFWYQPGTWPPARRVGGQAEGQHPGATTGVMSWTSFSLGTAPPGSPISSRWRR